jgi:hypothetical protein
MAEENISEITILKATVYKVKKESVEILEGTINKFTVSEE